MIHDTPGIPLWASATSTHALYISWGGYKVKTICIGILEGTVVSTKLRIKLSDYDREDAIDRVTNEINHIYDEHEGEGEDSDAN